MKQFTYTLLIVIIATCIICLFIRNNVSTVTIDNTKIDSIKVINDSIHEIIRESEVKIEYIKSEYNEKMYIIDTQSVYSDIKLFSDFVSKDSL